MKQVCAIFSVLALSLQLQHANARSVDEELSPSHSPFEDAPLVQWDEPDVMAQQQPPAPATTPPAGGTTQTPATPPVTVTPPAGTVETPPAATSTPTDPETTPPAEEGVTPAEPPDENAGEDDFSLGDIPIVETIELKPDTARKALDTYILVRDKYKDAELENFENLQDFVDQSPQGKAFEADVKAAGFPNVIEWNTTITTLSFAYDNSIEDQTADIKQQISELQADTEMAQDMRDRMVAALNAMIPSDNNKKVLEELKADPAYAEKLKMLESETE